MLQHPGLPGGGGQARGPGPGAAWSTWACRDVGNELAGSLPYGDQRRLEIARALATEPKLLLLDEPAAGMNPARPRTLMDLIRRIRDELG